MGSNPIGHPRSSQAAFRAYAAAAIERLGARDLHAMRVALRRLRCALRVFRSCLRRKSVAPLERELRALQRATGAARDWEVFLEAQPSPVLRRHAQAAARPAQRRARRAAIRLQSIRPDLRDRCARLPWRAGFDAGQPVQALGSAILKKVRRRVLASGRKTDWASAAGRHRMRIKLKRLRYASEIFAADWPPAATREFDRRLVALQDILGEMNDIGAQRALLEKLGDAGAPESAIRAAARRLDGRERRLRKPLRAAWKEFRALKPYWRRPEAARGRG